MTFVVSQPHRFMLVLNFQKLKQKRKKQEEKANKKHQQQQRDREKQQKQFNLMMHYCYQN